MNASVSMSTLEVASSSTRILFFLRRALARQSSCFWPTEKDSEEFEISVCSCSGNWIKQKIHFGREFWDLNLQVLAIFINRWSVRRDRYSAWWFLWRGKESGESLRCVFVGSEAPFLAHHILQPSATSPTLARPVGTIPELLKISLLLSSPRFQCVYLQVLWSWCRLESRAVLLCT